MRLAGGRGQDEAAGWQEAQDGTPSFVKTCPVDSPLANEHDDVFELKHVIISFLKSKVFSIYSTFYSVNEIMQDAFPH